MLKSLIIFRFLADFGRLEAEVFDFVLVLEKDFGGLEADVLHFTWFLRRFEGSLLEQICGSRNFGRMLDVFWPENKSDLP